MSETEFVGDIDAATRGVIISREKECRRKAVIAHSLALWIF